MAKVLLHLMVLSFISGDSSCAVGKFVGFVLMSIKQLMMNLVSSISNNIKSIDK